ncbi:hypothetical protein MPER_07355, partial [Moniliophthora perniciosa FA553]
MDICLIPTNSDIAGLGVRVATYMQACVALLVTLLAITYRFMDSFAKMVASDNEDGLGFAQGLIRRKEISSLLPGLKSTLVGLRNGLFVASVSVLISAIVLAYNEEGLTVYHGLITLNLAQLNSLSSLFVWLVNAFMHESSDVDFINVAIGDADFEAESTTSREHRAFRVLLKQILKGAVHFAVHASLAGGFGLWFWSDQSRFEGYSAGLECVTNTAYWFFVPVDSHNTRLRDFFLAYNALLVFPLTAPIAATLFSVAIAAVVITPFAP